MNTMNEDDEKKLIDYWLNETNILNDWMDAPFKKTQLHAYQLGLDRGREEAKAHSYNEVINTLCRDLPEGYQIVIECEQGSGQVKLLLPDSDEEIDGYIDDADMETRALSLLDRARCWTGLNYCIGCGCNEAHACVDKQSGQPCSWIRLDVPSSRGLCSACAELAEEWDAGRRDDRVPIDLPEAPE